MTVFQIYKSRSPKRSPQVQFGVRLRGDNGEIVWKTETYTRKENAEAAIKFLRDHALYATVEDLTDA